MLQREVLQHIDLMLHPGGEEYRGTPVKYEARHHEAMRTAPREVRQKLQQSQRHQKKDYDLRFIDLTCPLCLDKVKNYSPFGRVPGL